MLNTLVRISATCAMAAAMLAAPATAQTGQAARAGAHGLSASVATTPVAGVGATLRAGPLGASAGTGPASFDNSGALLAGSGALNLRLGEAAGTRTDLGLSTGALTSRVTGGASGVFATASVDRLALSIDATLAGLLGSSTTTLLGLNAGTLTSTARYDAATNSFSGGATVVGLSGITTLGGLGLGVGATAGGLVQPAANSVLLNAAGLVVTLNEQLRAGDLFTVNALSLRFTDFLAGTNVVNGSIILGQSQVERIAAPAPIAAVPEPATWAMMIAGFAMVGAAARTRRRGVATA